MSPLRMAAVSTVTLALTLYTIGTFKEQRSRRATRGVRAFLTLGVMFDVTATGLMVVAAGGPGLTLHGVLGYSALAAMLLDTVLLWRHAARGPDAPVPHGLHVYSLAAYLYWLIAYFTGAALVMVQRAAG